MLQLSTSIYVTVRPLELPVTWLYD